MTEQLMTTEQVAALVQMSTDWVRDHQVELGAVRLGDGPRGALRFERARVLAAMDDRRVAERRRARATADPSAPTPTRRKPGRRPQPKDRIDLLPIRDVAA